MPQRTLIRRSAPLLSLSLAVLACEKIDPVKIRPDASGAFPAQVAPPNGSVDIPPQIVIANNGTGIAGIAVNFVPRSGSGVVDGGSVVTDENGLAKSDNWTLGPSAGVQTVDAMLGGASIPLTATAVACPADLFTESATASPYGTAFYPLSGTQPLSQWSYMSDTDCGSSYGTYDRYSMVVDASTGIFGITNDNLFQSYYTMLRLDDALWGSGDPSNPLYVILPAGTYHLAIIGNPGGLHSLGSTNGPSNSQRNSCYFYVAKGINAGQTIDNTCSGMNYFIGVSGNAPQATARVNATWDVRVDAYSCDGSYMSTGSGATGDKTLTVTFTSGTYACVNFFVYSGSGSGGNFTLRVN